MDYKITLKITHGIFGLCYDLLGRRMDLGNVYDARSAATLETHELGALQLGVISDEGEQGRVDGDGLGIDWKRTLQVL